MVSARGGIPRMDRVERQAAQHGGNRDSIPDVVVGLNVGQAYGTSQHEIQPRTAIVTDSRTVHFGHSID